MVDQVNEVRTARVAPWAYGWWVLVGALAGLGVAGLLTIGVVFLAVAVVLVIVGLRVPALRGSAALGAIGGLAAAPLYLAWLNRSGPGRVCTTSGVDTTCADQLSPWPFVAVAVVLVVVCVVLVRRSRTA
ncbi:hypothetical protein [Cellulomonas sp.]|uniref:hypothetical protein n=1 Tax=Cellulomonas sp. TaxID=40001 RepID=UPI001B0C8F64|nr:hypothetical protein [Cellulomonas sp.]MBO9556022.1 hypothetical protein [Cellulomonas sp.]